MFLIDPIAAEMSHFTLRQYAHLFISAQTEYKDNPTSETAEKVKKARGDFYIANANYLAIVDLAFSLSLRSNDDDRKRRS